jgi:hypothetical protein
MLDVAEIVVVDQHLVAHVGRAACGDEVQLVEAERRTAAPASRNRRTVRPAGRLTVPRCASIWAWWSGRRRTG